MSTQHELDEYMGKFRTLLSRQRQYFATGETRDVEFRLKFLRALRKSIIKHEQEILDALHSDLGKAPQESYFTELNIVLNELKYHISNLEDWALPEKLSTPWQFLPSKSYVVNEPLGCVLVLSPWNYPFHLCMYPLIGAISAGNCVILKPSPLSPATNAVIRRIIQKIFPRQYVSVVEADNERTELIVREKFDLIFYTGGKKFAQTIMRAAAENITPVVLELGGKTPVIIDDEAVIDLTAKRIAWGKFLSAGQTCVAPDYIYVKEKYLKDFANTLKQYIEEFYGTDASLSDCYPKIVNRENVTRLAGYLNDGRVIYGGQYDEESRYFSPTIMVDIKPDSPITKEEIFGPIVPIFTFKTLSEPISYINSQPKPLALYYFGDSKMGLRVMDRIQSGIACINDVVIPLGNHYLPFGGVGESGMGNYHGKHSFETFSHKRGYMVSYFRMDQIFKYVPFRYFSFAKRMLRKD